MRKKSITCVVAVVFSLILGGIIMWNSGKPSYASLNPNPTVIKSQGRIRVPSPDGNTANDVIYDARDIYDLYRKCQ